MFITELLLIWPVGGPSFKKCVTKPTQMPRESELTTYQFECDTLT